MSQYREGTVDVSVTDPVVIGHGTEWLTYAHAGDIFMVHSTNVPYIIGTVDADDQITLSAPYAGASLSGQAYEISTSFTPILGLPYMEQGDLDTHIIFKEAMLRVEQQLTGTGVVDILVDGTVASPGIQWFNENSTGFYRKAVGQIGVAILGALAGYFASTGLVLAGKQLDTATIVATGLTTTNNLAVTRGTITTSDPVTITQTWNAGGITFTGLDLNVTSTASAAASILANLRVGGTSQWKVDKTGATTQLGGATMTALTATTGTFSSKVSAVDSGLNPAANVLGAFVASGGFGGGYILADGTGRAGMWTKSSGAVLHIKAAGTSGGFTTDDGMVQVFSTGATVNGVLIVTGAFKTDSSLYAYAAKDDGILALGQTNTNESLRWLNAAGHLIGIYANNAEQVRIIGTASATRFATITGSNGGSPALGTSGGNLSLTANTNAVESLADFYIKPHSGVLSFLRMYNADSSNESFIKDTGGTGASILTFFTGGNEAGRFTNGTYFKASNTGTYPDLATNCFEFASYHDGAHHAMQIYNGAATTTNQYGVEIVLAGDPNDATRYFLKCTGNASGRFTIRSNGDIDKNGTAYTNPDYVFEHWATGKIVKFAGKEGASDYGGRMTLQNLESFARENWHLPGFGQGRKHGLFEGSEKLLASVEEAYLHLFDHEKEIADLKAWKTKATAALAAINITIH